MLTATEINRAIAVSGVFYRIELTALMGAITKRLAGTFAAATPKIIFAGFDIRRYWSSGRNNRFAHSDVPSLFILPYARLSNYDSQIVLSIQCRQFSNRWCFTVAENHTPFSPSRLINESDCNEKLNLGVAYLQKQALDQAESVFSSILKTQARQVDA